jgi:hypothetical protein
MHTQAIIDQSGKELCYGVTNIKFAQIQSYSEKCTSAAAWKTIGLLKAI